MLSGLLPFAREPLGEELEDLGLGRVEPIMGVSEEANNIIRGRFLK